MRNSPEYYAYAKLKNGAKAKGHALCRAWQKSFVNFFADMGKDNVGLKRIVVADDGKPYSKKNCAWATFAVGDCDH